MLLTYVVLIIILQLDYSFNIAILIPSCFQHTAFAFDCLILSICSAVGQLFIYYTIEKFGPVVFIIIMTIRQVSIMLKVKIDI